MQIAPHKSMTYNRVVCICLACKPIKLDNGKYQSQWVDEGGCPYCGATGLMRVKGYLEYIAQYCGNSKRHITKLVNMSFGIKI